MRWDQIGWRQSWSVGLALLAAAGCTSQQPLSTADKAAKAVPVKTVAVAEETLERKTTQPATVHAYFRAEVRAKASGFVEEIKADIGDVVEAGQELAIIGVPEVRKKREVIEARIERFAAEETRAEAGIELATARVRSAEAKLAQTKSELDSAEASLAAAEAEFSRTEDLVQRQSLQPRMLDEARKKRDAERANKQAMASSIQSAEAEVTVAEAQQRTAEADLTAAKAETDIARRQLEEIDVLLDYATIRAPFAGVVTDRTVDPGNLVREASEVGSGQPLFVISQVDKLRVRIPIPESDAPLVNRGDKVTLTFPSFSDQEAITGTVTRRSGSLDPSTRTMIVEADIANTDGKLLPGMFGEATIDFATKVAAQMLPSRAVRFDESGQAYVYVVGAEDTVSVTSVTTGLDDGNRIQILSGVNSGTRVIDAHLKRFSDGQQVALLND